MAAWTWAPESPSGPPSTPDAGGAFPAGGIAATMSRRRWTLLCSHSFCGAPASITESRNSTASWSCSSVGSLTDVSSVQMRARIVRLSCTSSSAYAVSAKNLRCSSVGSDTHSKSMCSMRMRKPSSKATHRASFSFPNVDGLTTMRGPP